jgi:hypothetical protein
VSDIEDAVHGMLDREEITTQDADAILEFADFLAEAGPHPNHPDHDPERYRAAINNHREFVLGEE